MCYFCGSKSDTSRPQADWKAKISEELFYMFKTFLHFQNKSIQLIILLSIWSALFLIGIYTQTLFIQKSAGLSSTELNDFLTNGLYENPQLIFVSNALFQLLAFLLPGLLFAYLAAPQPLKYLGLKRWKSPAQFSWIIIAGVGLVFFIGVLGTWIQQIDFGATVSAIDEQRKKVIEIYMQSGNVGSLFRNLFLIALLPAICEEVFFRGVLQKFAYSFTGKWWLSIIMASVIFTLFHASISEFLPILLAGIVLGTVYYLTGNLWLSILLHFVHNGLQITMAYLSDSSQTVETEGFTTLLAYFVGAAMVLAYSLWQLYRNRTPLPDNWSVEHKAEPLERED